MTECDFLNEYTRGEYETLRAKYPEDGSEKYVWQKFPKLPEEGRTVITFNGDDPDCDIEFDELCFREDIETEVEHTYWRHHYFWDKVNYDIHYWMYAPLDPPGDYGYNVGD